MHRVSLLRTYFRPPQGHIGELTIAAVVWMEHCDVNGFLRFVIILAMLYFDFSVCFVCDKTERDGKRF